MSARAPIGLAVCLALAACGGPGGTTPHRPTIEEIRARAAAHPNDPDAIADLAEGELLVDGGDPARALSAIDAAIARDLHGAFDEGFAEHVRVIDAARTHADPWAPVLAEASVSAIEDYDDTLSGFPRRVSEAFAPLAAEPGRLGAAARHAMREVL